MNDCRTAQIRQPQRFAASVRNRAGFTMVELITVIGIIALLATLTVVGLKQVGGNSKAKETRARMERLRNGLGEVMLTPQARTRVQQVVIPQIFVGSGGANWDAVPSSSGNALFKTGQILTLFSANSAFKKFIDDLPITSKQTLIFNLVDNSGTNKAWTVADPQPAKPFNQSQYIEFTFPLDSWGNPIIFVFDTWETPGPGGTGIRRVSAANGDTGGLTDLYSDSTKTKWEAANRANRPQITDTGTYPYDADMTSRSTHVRAGFAFRNDADRGSFWFSAGPDGKYQTHDDNLYSFEGN